MLCWGVVVASNLCEGGGRGAEGVSGASSCDAKKPAAVSSLVVSRRAVMLAAVGWMIPPALVAQAAVPTIDDYYGRAGGAQKKVSGYAAGMTSKQKGDNTPADSTTENAGDDVEDSIRNELQNAEESFDNLRKLIKAQAWDDVRISLQDDFKYLSVKGRSPEVKEAFKKIFAATAAPALEQKDFLSVTLTRLKDIAFSNRIIFFNSVDKRQVSELADTMDVDLEEPLGLVDDAESSISSMLELIVRD